MKYDVIIIGSGLGGLECATILSRQGMSVLVLESQIQPGGAMQSYSRRDAEFDTGLHYVGGLGEGQSLHGAFSYLGLMDLPWQRLDPQGFDHVTIEGDTCRFVEGYDNFVHYFAERFPHERHGLQLYADMLRASSDEQLNSLLNPSAGNTHVQEQISTNAWQWLNSTFTDSRLIDYLSGTSLKMELHKDTLPLFTFLHGNGPFIESSWRLAGPGHVLVDRLIANIRHHGGEVICGARVEELQANEGRIVAALCSNGERYEADRFISSLHPHATTSLITQPGVLKPIYRRRMASLANTFGMLTVSLRLKPETVQYINHNKFIYSHPDVWTLSEPGSSNRGVLVSCPYTGSPYASTLDLLTPMLWSECAEWADTTVGHRGPEYKAMKQARAEALISLAETQMPGLAEAIDQMYVSTPLTYRDYNGVPEGGAYGIRKDSNNALMTLLTPRTPVPNLFMTGQSLMLHGLHGVTMTSLFTCAEVLGGTGFLQSI